MRRVMRDDALEAKFQRDGYVEIPFISKEEVDTLKQKYFDTLPSSGGQITASETGVTDSKLITYDFTFIDKNPDYKRQVFDIITSHFASHMNKWLDDYKPIIANYIHKKHEGGEVPLHQNWSFADEKKCSTVSIWCPLVDSTVQNGTLQVVPSSHKRFGEIRGPMVPWELENVRQEIIDNYLIPLEAKAGDCVILDDSILHYSAINKTSGLRLTIQLICIPSELPSWHYHMNHAVSNTKVDILEVDKDFYMEFNPWKFPANVKKVGELEYAHALLDASGFKQQMKGPRFDAAESNPNFIRKIKEAILG